MSHEVADLLIFAAGYASGIWSALMWNRTRRTPRHKETS